jgi:hypothetical protein
MDNLRVSNDTPTNYEAFTCALMTVGEGMQSKPFLNLTYQLVDKDLSKVEDRRDVFNIGDGCVLAVEEKVTLPQNLKQEVRQEPDAEAKKAAQKQFDKEVAIKYRKLFAPKMTEEMQRKRVMPLRDPCLRSELELSGMKASRTSTSSNAAFRTTATILCPIST